MEPQIDERNDEESACSREKRSRPKVRPRVTRIADVVDSRCAYAKIKRGVEHSARACPVREGTTLLFSSRRTFLQSLSRSALVLSLENVFALACRASWNPFLRGFQRAPASVAHETSGAIGTAASAGSLGISFLNVARESGLNVKTIFGGEHKNKYLLETTGCGVAFYDYDNDGWLDIFLVNGSRLEGFAAVQTPTSHLFKNNRDGTFIDVTAKAGVGHAGWGQ